MGCGSSKGEEVDNPNKIKDVAHFKISSSGMVSQKHGLITNDYTLLKPLIGKGVNKVTNQIRAIQVISKEKANKMEDHPNIIKIYEFYYDGKNTYIVTELCTGGELKKAAETLKQILNAVNYLHKSKIVHRDLKPENILYEPTQPQALLKIVDFGTSRMFEQGYKMNQKLGTIIK
ncbi:unnamed protein product [Paramecium sonneborni]|uniref:Protein kinase domain-containing protein n=1 Tax=Paramecium sonneborni TaxID=65129 RepID=A0A8S1RUU5_9CILI|nr:unnamed protein product [Paramecium sonneborni]